MLAGQLIIGLGWSHELLAVAERRTPRSPELPHRQTGRALDPRYAPASAVPLSDSWSQAVTWTPRGCSVAIAMARYAASREVKAIVRSVNA
jgi:hypothetical protein